MKYEVELEVANDGPIVKVTIYVTAKTQEEARQWALTYMQAATIKRCVADD